MRPRRTRCVPAGWASRNCRRWYIRPHSGDDAAGHLARGPAACSPSRRLSDGYRRQRPQPRIVLSRPQPRSKRSDREKRHTPRPVVGARREHATSSYAAGSPARVAVRRARPYGYRRAAPAPRYARRPAEYSSPTISASSVFEARPALVRRTAGCSDRRRHAICSLLHRRHTLRQCALRRNEAIGIAARRGHPAGASDRQGSDETVSDGL